MKISPRKQLLEKYDLFCKWCETHIDFDNIKEIHINHISFSPFIYVKLNPTDYFSSFYSDNLMSVEVDKAHRNVKIKGAFVITLCFKISEKYIAEWDGYFKFELNKTTADKFIAPSKEIIGMYVSPKEDYLDVYVSKYDDLHKPYAHIIFKNKEELYNFIKEQLKIYTDCKVYWWGKSDYIFKEHIKGQE